MNSPSSEVKAETFNIGPTPEFTAAFEHITGRCCSPANVIDCIRNAPDEFERVREHHAAVAADRGDAPRPEDTRDDRAEMLAGAESILDQIEDATGEIERLFEQVSDLATELCALDDLPDDVSELSADLQFVDDLRELCRGIKHLRAALDDLADNDE